MKKKEKKYEYTAGFGNKEVFSFPVKCIKNTNAYFAERLYKAMKVRNSVLF